MLDRRQFGVLANLGLVFCALIGYAQTPDPSGQQGPASSETSCFSPSILSVPSRPTVSNATDTTQCGAVELEYGFEREWASSATHQTDVGGGLRLGITPRLDFHWFLTDFLSIVNPSAQPSGFGDTWLGLKYRFSAQDKHVPSFGIFYQAKVPSADERNGMGTGQVDHSISFLASKDIGRVHLDFNVIEVLAGRQSIAGDDHQTGSALASWITLNKKLTLVIEGHGVSELNPSSPAFASALIGVSYRVNHRVVLDGGIDSGITQNAPDERAFVGITYTVANLYHALRPWR